MQGIWGRLKLFLTTIGILLMFGRFGMENLDAIAIANHEFTDSACRPTPDYGRSKTTRANSQYPHG